MRRLPRRAGVVLAIAGLTAAGCASRKPSEGMSSEEIYQRAEAYMQAGKPGKAVPWYEKVDTSRDNTLKAQVHLRLADAYFERGGILYLAEAQTRYQSFLNFFPLSDQAPYAQYRFAICLSKQVNKPERDQAQTYKTIEEFRKVELLYPSSTWVGEARQRIDELEDHLSRDALMKARFYYRKKAWAASISRLKEILEKNPDFGGRDEVLFLLGSALRSFGREAEGATYLEQLRKEFPDSDWTDKAGGLGHARLEPGPSRLQNRRLSVVAGTNGVAPSARRG